MASLNRDIETLREQVEAGVVPRAYRGLIDYMNRLRTHFQNNVGGYSASGLYQGRMDYTFFSVFTPTLKKHSLKAGIMFNYSAFRFEVWLLGRNRSVQKEYWQRLSKMKWPKCRVSAPGPRVESILERDIATRFNLDKPDLLTQTIENGVVVFVNDIEKALQRNH